MARYRTYASGIYGYKYKDLFVEKDREKKVFRVVGLFSKNLICGMPLSRRKN